MAVMDYRTQDGLAEYGFSIEFQPGLGWRVYIIFEPFRQGHNDGLGLPYQSIDRDGRRYVDWSSKLDGLGEAKTVATLWAELATRYQRTEEQHALYVELIERHERTQEKRRATSADSNRLDAEVGAGEAGTEYQDRGSVIPRLRTPANSLNDPPEGERSGRVENEVA
jgi:hypothetical protein